MPNDAFLGIDQINRLWGEYDLALQERELAARSEAHRLDRLHWAGNRATRECKTVDAQLIALERHVPEVRCHHYFSDPLLRFLNAVPYATRRNPFIFLWGVPSGAYCKLRYSHMWACCLNLVRSCYNFDVLTGH